MANRTVDFKVGTQFVSIDKFRARLLLYENQEFANFVVHSSQRLKVIPNTEIDENVVKKIYYKSAHFKCKTYGEPRVTVSEEDRQRQTSSYKDDCSSGFRLNQKKSNGRLILQITKLDETHNHMRNDQLYKSMPKQRAKVISEASDYLQKVIDVRPSYQLIQARNSTTEGVMKRRDLYNFRKKHTNQEEISDLERIANEMQNV